MPPSVRGFCMGIAACGSAVRVQGRRMAMPPAGASGDVLWRKKPAGGARSCVGLRSRGLRRRLCPRRAVRSCAHLREHRRTYCEKTPGSRAVMCRLRSRGLRRRLCPRGAVRSCARLRERQETYCEKNAREPCGHVSAAKPGTAEAALSAWGGAELRPPAGASRDVLRGHSRPPVRQNSAKSGAGGGFLPIRIFF